MPAGPSRKRGSSTLEPHTPAPKRGRGRSRLAPEPHTAVAPVVASAALVASGDAPRTRQSTHLSG